jgi:hypothetical protein
MGVDEEACPCLVRVFDGMRIKTGLRRYVLRKNTILFENMACHTGDFDHVAPKRTRPGFGLNLRQELKRPEPKRLCFDEGLFFFEALGQRAPRSRVRQVFTEPRFLETCG